MTETHYPDSHHDVYSKTTFGFWIYILTDFMLFATLFAAYAVLHDNLFGGPPFSQLFNLELTLVQTLILLVSTFTISLAGASAHRKKRGVTITLFLITFLLGIAFVWMQQDEFFRFIESGNSWSRSAALSAYFTLLGTFVLHILIALLWIVVLIIPVCLEGLTPRSIKRLTCFRMFWQFLNVVWIFIFSIVYLLGVIR
ncbi:MAG: Cytochrome bo(3) ubiquinol oxidase subunit 3 [Chlamydiae bacterium]|nr:Cytochrome bo(3) ubiquinol oxidase subunit 3 [Chlamydiota bacterium]